MFRPALALCCAALMSTSACEMADRAHASGDKSVDRGRDAKPLSELQAGIWIDPNGCDHWIVDDGVEGYLSPRLDARGRPVCSGTPERSRAIGPFKSGGSALIGDPI